MIVQYLFYLVVQLWWDNIFELFRPTISMLFFITSWSGFEFFINVQTCRQNVVNANPRWNSPFLSFKQNSPKFQPIKTRILMRAKLRNQNIVEMDMCQHSWKQFPQAILFRKTLFATMCTHFYRTRVRSLAMLVSNWLTDSLPFSQLESTWVWSLSTFVTYSLTDFPFLNGTCGEVRERSRNV